MFWHLGDEVKRRKHDTFFVDFVQRKLGMYMHALSLKDHFQRSLSQDYTPQKKWSLCSMYICTWPLNLSFYRQITGF